MGSLKFEERKIKILVLKIIKEANVSYVPMWFVNKKIIFNENQIRKNFYLATNCVDCYPFFIGRNFTFFIKTAGFRPNILLINFT